MNADATPPSSLTVPVITGDGIGPEVMAATRSVADAAASNHGVDIEWIEVLAGEEAAEQVGDWLPQATLDTISEHGVALKGPLTTPIGGGFRSLNVAIRQLLDLYACVRPIRYFEGVNAPVVAPQDVDVVIFRENTEDIYGGLEFAAGSPEADKLRWFCEDEFGWQLEEDSGLGLKAISKGRSQRLQRAAMRYALEHATPRVTLVHKGNIMKHTEGAFSRWGHELAKEEFGDQIAAGDLVVNDIIADNAFQQLLLNPSGFDVIATMNLNGDFLSDAVAAQVGGIGIAPGANINYDTGVAVFEATHGTAPGLAGKDMANPSSLILSTSMMFGHVGHHDIASEIVVAVEDAVRTGDVTGDLADPASGKDPLTCSEYAAALVGRL
ncbi:MAG: isocitrate/isopropylmalate family dehydrogenase [Actinomycetota bacterium]